MIRALTFVLMVFGSLFFLPACAPTENSCTPKQCADFAGQCGTFVDGCGGTVTCNDCLVACTPESDKELCRRLDAECGPVTATDNCGTVRNIANCGNCQSPSSCGGRGVANECFCVSETDTEFCQRQGKNCGQVKALDNCGKSRQVTSCGTCTGNTTCGANNICAAPQCTPETDAAFCLRFGKNCGSVSGQDNCGKSRTVSSCGSCTNPQTCGAGGKSNVCGCVSESDALFCNRLGKTCGSATAVDNCGKSRSVVSCGTCTGNTQCTSAGVCACVPKSGTQLCSALGKTCGQVSTTDNCGAARTLNCGSCFGVSTCGGGGTPNVCGCTPKTDAEMCSARGANCGTFSMSDNCGGWRSYNCGNCTAPNSCGAGGVANVCACLRPTDSQVCAAGGKNCGTFTTTDVCGASRTVFCGNCSSPTTCGGGGTSNVCGCAPESDAQFCQRLGKNCGSVTDLDSCGVSRTVANCGTCTAFSQCGADGTPNVCSGRAEPMNEVCGGGYCWKAPKPVGSKLNKAITSPSGNNWVVGASGTILRWDGAKWSGWFAVVNFSLKGVFAFSDSDVWAVGDGGTLIHFNGTSWTSVNSGTQQNLTDVWGTSTGEVWVVGDKGTVLRRASGSNFTAVTMSTTEDLASVYGIGTDIWVGGETFIFRFNGSTWTTTPVQGPIYQFWGSSLTDIWAVSPNGTYRFTGAQWVPNPYNRGVALAGTSATDVYTFYNDSFSGLFVKRFDGLSWSSTQTNDKGIYRSVTANPDGTLLLVGDGGALLRRSGGGWWRQDRFSIKNCKQLEVKEDAFLSNSIYPTPYTSYYRVYRYSLSNGTLTNDFWSQKAITLALLDKNNFWVSLSNSQFCAVSGSAWSFSTAPGRFASMAPVSPSSGFAVEDDKIYQYNGSTWTQMVSPSAGTNITLKTVNAVSPTHVWAGGSGGALFFYNGTSWGAVQSGVTQDIKAVHSLSATRAIASGTFGVIQWNGTTWTPTSYTLPVLGAWPDGTNTFWLIDAANKIKRWDGTQFVDMAPWLQGQDSMNPTLIKGDSHGIWIADHSCNLLKY